MTERASNKQEGAKTESGVEEVTSDSIRQKRIELETKVESLKLQKNDDIDSKLTEREEIVGERDKLLETLEEAKKTLAYYENQNEAGLLTEPEDKAELTSLETIVAELQDQEALAMEKYKAITNIPEVYEKVWDEAHAEKQSREISEMKNQAMEELKGSIEQFIKDLEHHSAQLAKGYSEQDVKKAESDKFDSKLYSIVVKNVRNLPSEDVDKLENYKKYSHYSEYLSFLEGARKNYGLFKGKQKRAIDGILNQRSEFALGEVAKGEYYAVQMDIQRARNGLKELGKVLVSILDTAESKEKEILEKHPDAKNMGLAGEVYNQIQNMAKDNTEAFYQLSALEKQNNIPAKLNT